jgi:hypothetical protein
LRLILLRSAPPQGRSAHSRPKLTVTIAHRRSSHAPIAILGAHLFLG